MLVVWSFSFNILGWVIELNSASMLFWFKLLIKSLENPQSPCKITLSHFVCSPSLYDPSCTYKFKPKLIKLDRWCNKTIEYSMMKKVFIKWFFVFIQYVRQASSSISISLYYSIIPLIQITSKILTFDYQKESWIFLRFLSSLFSMCIHRRQIF